MYLRRTLLTIATSAVLTGTLAAQSLYRLDFHGHARSMNGAGHVSTRLIGARDLIATCVGTNAFGTNRDYALVYDPTIDTVEVVSATNGTVFCELFTFQGGITNSDGTHLDRFNFLFTPSETNAAGTAILRENIRHGTNRISIEGQLQFVLASLAPFSALSNSVGAGPSTNNNLVSPTALLSSAALGVPASPVVASDTNALSLSNPVTNNPVDLTVSTNTSLTAVLAPPGLPSTAITTNDATLTNLSGGGVPALTPTNTSATVLTNNLAAVAAADTNQLPVFSFTNGVICWGSFTGGKNIFAPSNP